MDDGDRVTVTHEQDATGRTIVRDKINDRPSKVREGGRALVGLLDEAVAYERVVQARSSSTQKLSAGAKNSPSPRMSSLLKSNINDPAVVF